MKIGIITFHRAINYGAALQTYALQKFLISRKYDVEVIDYRCEYMENFYKTMAFKGKTIKQDVRGLLNFYNSYKKKKQFRKFLSNNVRLSKKVYTKENIKEANKIYDKFITGSDQVFNFACSKFDTSYFLDFVEKPNKKLSYAASFGMKNVPKEYQVKYQELLSSFDDLSIREKDGQKIVKDLVKIDTELSVDPVFLLNVEDWYKIAKKPKFEKYILIYKLNTSNLIFDFARKLAQKTGCKIIALNFDTVDKLKTRDVKGISTASIEDFLGYFKYADYVVTNSFHGTAFSILFHKKFYVEALQKNFKPNDRVESLLEITGLNVSKIKTLDDCILDIKRDFEYSDYQIKKEQARAAEYLETVLNGESEEA